MRALLLDELEPRDVARVREYLDREAKVSGIEGLYWVELPPESLSPEQLRHHDCRPHRFAVEVGEDRIKVELLVRPAVGLRCTCCQMADPDQRGWILAWADRLTEELGLST